MVSPLSALPVADRLNSLLSEETIQSNACNLFFGI
jgi:hypothetical protein